MGDSLVGKYGRHLNIGMNIAMYASLNIGLMGMSMSFKLATFA